jgi:hypothetical protein
MGNERERKHGEKGGKESHPVGIERLKGKEVDSFEIIRCNSKEADACYRKIKKETMSRCNGRKQT